jgi:hypothetical protein
MPNWLTVKGDEDAHYVQLDERGDRGVERDDEPDGPRAASITMPLL